MREADGEEMSDERVMDEEEERGRELHGKRG